MKFIVKILISTCAVLVSAWLLPGVNITNNNFGSAILVALVISFLNAVVKPILVVLTIPITFVTLGLFLLVINALIILFADYLVEDFEVTGFWPALFFSIILSLVNSLFERIQKRTESDDRY
jgi:putative membrane protein